jgi:bla regulator protein blaR1
MTNHLWQSTIFAVVAGLLTVVFRKNRAQVRYWLWLSASLKFLIPFSLLISLGSHLEWAPAARTIAAPVVSSTMVQFSQPFPETVSFVHSTAGTLDWVPMMILGVWACGFAAIARMRLRGWLRVRAAMRSSSPLEIPVPVEVRSSPGLLEPGVVGFLRPILLLPEGIAECLTPRQLEAVLAHELCHIHRRDNLTSAIHMIVEAVFWFHPLVWWIGARLVDERERACDEAVLSLGNEPQVYAEGILNVCKTYLGSPLRCVSGVTGSDLKKRIQAILTGRVAGELSFAKRVALAVAGIAALALPVLIGVLNAPAIRAQAPAVTPKFEVASIRPCGKDSGPGGNKQKGDGPSRASVSQGRLSTGCVFLANAELGPVGLIQRAYGRLGIRHVVPLGFAPPVSGGPAWIYSDLYSINATAEGNANEALMEGPMLQALLEDRFKLKLHRASKEIPAYALTVAKGGSKLLPFKEGSCIPVDFTKSPIPPPPPGQTNCNAIVGGRRGPNTRLEAEAINLDYFSKLLSLVLDRPVIEKTGISGKFDFHLSFLVDQTTPGALFPELGQPSDDSPAASIFTVLQEQLGLKLEPAKGTREYLVIDHVERPTEN